jgi:hypothetical protein
MEGFEVIGSDDNKIGTIVAVEDDLLIVEGGLVRKTRHAVPVVFAEQGDDHAVRLTLAKDVVTDSPAVGDDLDRQAIAEYYGLAEAFDAPETQGEGELAPGDPALSAEQEGRAAGVEPAAERRARIREGHSQAGPRGEVLPADDESFRL